MVLFSVDRPLPQLPETIMKMKEICENPDSSINDLVTVAGADPMVLANLLKVANSPFYNFRRQIFTAAQAVSLLGMNTTLTVSLGGAVIDSFGADLSPYNTNLKSLVDTSLSRAGFIRKWDLPLGSKEKERLALSAFLLDIGRIIISNELEASDMVGIFMNSVSSGSSFLDAEIEHMGVSFLEVGAEAFSSWGFDPIMGEAVKFSSLPALSPAEVRLEASALHVVQMLINSGERSFEPNAVAMATRACSELGMSTDALASVIKDISENSLVVED